MMTIAAIIGVIGFTAFQILDIRMPLKAPTSDLTSEPGNSEWTTINRTLDGSGPVPGETTEFSGNIRWSFNAGDSLASTPSVKNGVVYLTTLDKQVIALDEATGEVIWEHASVAPIDASPTIAGNILVYGARDRRVIALDITTGDKLWEFVTEANPTAGSALVEDGIAYIGSGDSNVYAVDVMTGEKQWHYPTREWITNTPALAEGILVVGSLDGRIGLYDTDTGKRRFEFRGINRQILGSPVIAGDDIFITYRNGLMYSLNLQEEEVVFHNQWHRMKMQLFWWNMMGNPGHPKGVNWSTFLWGTLVTSPAVDEDMVYVSTNEGRMYGVDRETGKKVWVYISGSTRLSSPTLVNGVLLVSDNQGVVHAVDSKTGKETWSIPVATRSSSKPVVANGSMYIASQDGTLYAVE
jgi:outer membrane protein assembly factor BamB